MPGRTRTASKPLSTRMLLAPYSWTGLLTGLATTTSFSTDTCNLLDGPRARTFRRPRWRAGRPRIAAAEAQSLTAYYTTFGQDLHVCANFRRRYGASKTGSGDASEGRQMGRHQMLINV